MQEPFNLKQLQLRHPEAFFSSLHFGQFRFSLSDQVFIKYCILMNFIVLLIGFICLGLSLIINRLFDITNQQAISLAIILFCFAQFPYQLWITLHQANVSSKRYANRLQKCLYLQALLILLISYNYFYIDSFYFSIITLIILAFISHVAISFEPLYKSNLSRFEILRLQKIRQIAYWSFQQSKNPQAISHTKDLKQYYLNLHQKCMYEEQQLTNQLQHKTLKACISDLKNNP